MWTKNCCKYTQGWLDGAMSGGGLPQASDIIFSADLTSSITPGIGAAGSFARASTIYYATGAATLTTASSGNPAIPAFDFLNGSSSGSGIQISGARKNQLTFSDDLSNAAWTTIGTLSVLSYAGTGSPDSAVTNSTQLTASSNNSGRDVDSGIAAANGTFIGSMFVKSTFGGNIGCTLTIEGTAGSETVSTSFTSTGTWQRIQVNKTFSGAAVGNAHLKILINSSGNSIVCMGGMLEDANAVGFVVNRTAQPSPLIRTSGATATTASDNLSYPSSNIITSAGTISAWVIPHYSSSEALASAGNYILSMNNDTISFCLDNGKFDFFYNGGSVLGNTTWTADVPMHCTASFDDTANALAVYKNGVSLNTSAAAITAPAAAAFNLGINTTLAAQRALDCPISRVRIWDVKLSDADVLTVYNAEKGFYGL